MINDDLVRTRNQLVIEKNCHRENQETWSRKEANSRGEQETLRASLKHYYQKQLNDVVNEKLREFQQQMDELETHFKMDYLRRERQIAERAIQQMELIYKKNEEEVRLLTERHLQEIKYVQLQLEMAQTTIGEAQQRLGGRGEGKREEVMATATMQVKRESTTFDGMSPQKKIDNAKRMMAGATINHNLNSHHSATAKAHSPDQLQGYMDTVRVVCNWAMARSFFNVFCFSAVSVAQKVAQV